MSRKSTLRASILCMAVIVSAKICTNLSANDVVQSAYKLRINGKIDEAKRQLQHALEKNVNDGDLLLELSRLEFQVSGTSRELDKAQKTINRAIAADSTEPVYHRWAARIALFNGILKSKQKDQMKN